MAKKTKKDLVVAAPVVALPPWAEGLEDRELLFVREYIKDLNGKQAYLRAFPHVTENSAGAGACVFLKRANVASAVQLALATSGGDNLRTSLLEELVAMATHDPGDYFSVDEQGEVHLKSTDNMDRRQRLAIAGIKVKKLVTKDGDESSEMEYKLTDKQSAIHKLLQGMGAYRAVGGTGDEGDLAPRIAIQVNISQDAKKVL